MTGSEERFVIDSCGWIEYFLDSPQAPRYAEFIEKVKGMTIICPTIVLFEVYKRVKSINGEDEALKAVVFIKSISEVVPLTETLSLSAADISLSESLHMADSLIYATAMESKAKVITGDIGLKNKRDVIFIEK
jgi:predicted nucleic acid-binding protein